jgi:hypothetical protein
VRVLFQPKLKPPTPRSSPTPSPREPFFWHPDVLDRWASRFLDVTPPLSLLAQGVEHFLRELSLVRIAAQEAGLGQRLPAIDVGEVKAAPYLSWDTYWASLSRAHGALLKHPAFVSAVQMYGDRVRQAKCPTTVRGKDFMEWIRCVTKKHEPSSFLVGDDALFSTLVSVVSWGDVQSDAGVRRVAQFLDTTPEPSVS